MKNTMRFKSIIMLAVLSAGLFAGAAQACQGSFYIIWMEGESDTDVYVRSVIVNGSGTADRYGTLQMPDSALGGDNPLYMFDLIKEAYVHNTKLDITTDGGGLGNCNITNDGDPLGNILDVQAADI